MRSAACPTCGLHTGWRRDGQRWRHRVTESPASAYCPNGARLADAVALLRGAGYGDEPAAGAA